jgi:O-antigen/teichoic acid export membrane protein
LFIQFYFLKNILSFSGEKRDKEWEKKIWKYIWPFISWGLFTWAQISTDKWSLSFFSSNKNVGLYTALYQIGYFPISVITGFGIQLLTPIFFQRAGDGVDLEKIKVVNLMASKINVIGLIITAITFLLSLLFHNQLFGMFFRNNDYLDISYLLPWLILSGGIFGCAQALSLELMSKMQTSNLAVIKIATALIGIIMNIIFAYLFQIKGVVFSSLVFSILYFLWIRYKIKINKSK